MDNRTDLLSLPEDLKDVLGMYLSGRDLLNILPTCKSLRLFYDDSDFWRRKYNNDFGQLPFPGNIKAQYLAAELFRDAKNCKRPDIRQIKFIYLFQYLQHHRKSPWAAYYQGVMKWFGWGMPLSRESGFNLWLESLDKGDFRAALSLACCWPEYVDSWPQVQDLGADDEEEFIPFRGMLPDLLKQLEEIYSLNTQRVHRNKVYAENAGHAALYLANFYNEGRFVPLDKDEARKWYLRALDHGAVQAVKPLADLGGPDALAAIACLDGLTARIKTETCAQAGMVLAEIHYQSGLLHESLGRAEEAETRFAVASTANHGAAMYRYAKCYQLKAANESDAVRLAKYSDLYRRYLKKAAHSGHEPAVIEWLGNMDVFNETVADHEKEFLDGNPAADILADRIGRIHCYSTEKHAAKNPRTIWWMQLYIQSMQMKKIHVRIDFEIMQPKVTDRCPMNHHVIYCLCARAIIYLFGVVGSTLEADYEKVKLYLERALRADPNAMNKYLEAGRKNNIISAEIEQIIRMEINRILPQNKPDAAPAVVRPRPGG